MADNQDFSDTSYDEEAYKAEQTQRFQANLAALQAGTLTNNGDIHGTLVQIGRRRMFEAGPLVARYPTHNEHEVHNIALMVLAYDLEMRECLDTALQFLTEDPDSDCRMRGASAAGVFMQGTNDRRTLAVLARVAANQQEDEYVRSSAYTAILSVIGRSNLEQFMASRDYPNNVDWDLVTSFLDKDEDNHNV